MKSITFAALLGLSAAKFRLGWCPDYQTQENFDAEAYSGQWFQVYRDRHNWWTRGADCVTKEFELTEDGNLDFYFRGFYNWHGWGKYLGIGGELTDMELGSPDTFTGMATMHGHCHWSKHWGGKKTEFQVLATDYENYDVSYYCKDFHGLFHFDTLDISSRKPEMAEEVQEEVRAVIEEKLPRYHLDRGMYWTKQGEDRCDYYWMSENNGEEPKWINWWH